LRKTTPIWAYGQYSREYPQKISSKKTKRFKSYKQKTKDTGNLCSKIGHFWTHLSLKSASGRKNELYYMKLHTLIWIGEKN